jgi:integrase
VPIRTNKDAGIGPKTESGIRTRLTFKGKNYEKTLPNKEQAKRWRAGMLIELAKCPEEIEYVRGYWRVIIDAPTGTIQKKFISFDDAESWLTSTKRKIHDGSYKLDASKNITVDEYVSTWLAGKARASGRTKQRYATIIRNQISPLLGTKRLSTLATSDVRAWVSKLVEMGSTASTIQKAYATLKQIFRTAFEDELVRRNPVVGIELPAVVRKEQTALTLEQLRALEEKCPSHQALILVMGLMGLRLGEARALQVQDVDSTANQLTVRRGFTHDESYRRVESTTKTKQVRVIPIPEVIQPLLAALVSGQDSNSWVFRGERGDAINDGWFRKQVFAPAVRSLGLEGVTVHNLRHTAASQLIASGTPITTVSRILGHTNIMQTLNTYGHYFQQDVETSMANLNAKYAAARGSKGDEPKLYARAS